MEFPILVYKAEGRYSRSHGTYDFTGVNNQEELDAKLKEGWFESLEAAIAGKSEVATPVQPTKKSAK